MGAVTSAHPSDRILSSFALGKLDGKSAGAVSKHLEDCPDGRKRVADMSADSFLGRIRGAQAPAEHGLSRFQTSGKDSQTGPNEQTPPPADTLPPGLAEHPDYEVKRELGRGGMGVVYLVHNKLMGRNEVLKVVRGHLINRPAVLDRFLREIRSAARLHHTNIVTAYSAFRAGESIVFAMEYVEGYDLAQLVKGQGLLPVAHACNFVYQAALGLQYAHEKGMVHRDIKPSNLILAREGKKPVVKVLDFGLAKVTSEGQGDSGLTREGQMLGTPDYIAPEQIRDAQSADTRADIYSLGCTLYFLLAGRPPFHGDSLWDLYQAHFSMDAGPLNLVRPEVPVELAALVAKMMAKDPGRRFQAPKEVAQALKPFFKMGSEQDAASKADVSRLGRTEADSPAILPRAAPAQSSANVGPALPAAAEHQQTAHSQPPAWESLLDLRTEEETVEDSRPACRTRGYVLRRVWAVAATALLLLGLLLAWAGQVLKLKTEKGVLVIENPPADAVVEIDGEKVTLTPAGGNRGRIEVRPGEHGVVVKRGDETLIGKSVSIESGKASTLTFSIEPLRQDSQEGAEGPAASAASTSEPKVRSDGLSAVAAGKSRAQRHADGLEAGTIWKGLSSYSYPAHYPRDMPVELAVSKRTGNKFEAVYKGDRGRVVCLMEGNVADGKIELKVTREISGLVDFKSAPFRARISNGRIDGEITHLTASGEPAHAKAFFVLEVSPAGPADSAGTESMPETAEIRNIQGVWLILSNVMNGEIMVHSPAEP